MTLEEIAALVQKGVTHSGFADSLKFDCGDLGQVVIADGHVGLENRDTDCTLKLSLDNLAKLVTGNLNPMTAVMMGKLKVSGNPAIALKLKELL
ncbi:Putative sterol carrier protein [Thalassovita autumnalis]|uniref:Sterol carrier protein n=1 Tax=Thalassovita autumnalis TaxID=2072972 RepID=A0A0N7LVI2_9RHOB|nr:SCP2 sterol-binding domain-containing protein [Thalassovita autumnalis]CUH66370.1 Putative sterol carrier protein [Thalassovita autumnalis]CUH72626.1 Putative sterol carrier protein [Thalassovita autumnalis]